MRKLIHYKIAEIVLRVARISRVINTSKRITCDDISFLLSPTKREIMVQTSHVASLLCPTRIIILPRSDVRTVKYHPDSDQQCCIFCLRKETRRLQVNVHLKFENGI